ncbi:MAG: hypothetical protein ACRD0Z_04945 [Acidimicrobiales bacterium]
MTYMVQTQAEPNLLDQVMPKPPRMSHVVLLMAAMLVLAGCALFASWAGVYVPHLGVDAYPTSSWGSGPGGRGAMYQFALQSAASGPVSNAVPVTIDGLDADVPGLTGAHVSFFAWKSTPGRTSQGRRLRLPFRLRGNDPVDVVVTWPRVACSVVATDQADSFQVKYKDFLGLSGTTKAGMEPWLASSSSSPSSPSSSSSSSSSVDRQMGWPEAITWTVCGHPVSSAPTQVQMGGGGGVP